MATYEKVSKLQQLKDTLKDMTWEERLEHLWEYYKWYAIGFVAVVAIIVSVICSWVENSKEVLYSGVTVNMAITEEGAAYLQDELFQKLRGEDETQRVDLTQHSLANLEEAKDASYALSNAMKLASMITAGEVDYVILDAYSLSYYSSNDSFNSLEALFTPEFLAQFEGKIVTFKSDDNNQEYPVAIDISDMPFVKKNIASVDKVYIAFPGNTGRNARNVEFLEYLMNWGG